MRVLLLVLPLSACSADWGVPEEGGPELFEPGTDDDGPDVQDAGPSLRVVGRVASQIATSLPVAPGPGFDCPDDTSGGVSGRLTPKTYGMGIRRLTLLGAEGTDDYVLVEQEDVSAVETTFLTAADTALADAVGTAAPGTYDGLELQVWWMEMTLPLVIEEVDADPANYAVTGWFSEVDPMQQRDLTFAIEDQDTGDFVDHWVDRGSWALASTEGSRPNAVLDLWHDEEFWADDPVTISTADAGDTEFDFIFDGDAFEIPDHEGSEFVVALTFDVAGRFTWWEDLPAGDPAEADGVFTVGADCGFRIMFPDVKVTVEKGAEP